MNALWRPLFCAEKCHGQWLQGHQGAILTISSRARPLNPRHLFSRDREFRNGKRGRYACTSFAGAGRHHKSSWSRSNAGLSRNRYRYRIFFMAKSQSFHTHPPPVELARCHQHRLLFLMPAVSLREKLVENAGTPFTGWNRFAFRSFRQYSMTCFLFPSPSMHSGTFYCLSRPCHRKFSITVRTDDTPSASMLPG